MKSGSDHHGVKSKPNLENRSLAALRGGHSEIAIDIWRNAILSQPPKYRKSAVRRRLSKKLMANALREIRDYLQGKGIDVFLVSGTFLGCIRDGDFISGDKDIDLGIFE
jgi:hypothetical protein